ncbi:MAG: DUF1080 domain-containing protein [Verrucomicrobiae bacterium]|nr:DUF1080 domain-containing protein [Verrucomicrobiae bacterium]
MKKRLCILVVVLWGLPAAFAAGDNPYVGRWALTIPGGGAGWLGVEEKAGKLHASVLWGGGSVLPVAEAKLEGNKLVLIRIHRPKDKWGKETLITETITATLEGDTLKLTTVRRNVDGKEIARAEFSGRRIPPLPPRPDLSRVKFGPPIRLFNGKDLSGWRLVNPNMLNGWSVQEGVLQNRVEKGKRYGNLRTEQEFEDFNLALEVRVPEKGNSGVYLRGIYEVQIADSYGKPPDSHNMGAIYSRIAPSVAAEKPAGQWQTLEMTLVHRHVTVVLNGQIIIDNQPLLGVTGGALTTDEFKPGPIMLQGDHTDVDYRNIVLRPALK